MFEMNSRCLKGSRRRCIRQGCALCRDFLRNAVVWPSQVLMRRLEAHAPCDTTLHRACGKRRALYACQRCMGARGDALKAVSCDMQQIDAFCERQAATPVATGQQRWSNTTRYSICVCCNRTSLV